MGEEPSWGVLPLVEHHAALLAAAAITPSTATSAGVYSVTEVEQIPAEFASYGSAVIPSLAFPYRSPLGGELVQLRPDTPVVIDGKPSKYLWPAGQMLLLNALVLDSNAGMVLLVEGTKQALAAASYAPESVEVYGMVGCRGWYRDGAPSPELTVCDDREVVVVLDADAATNPDVYAAGVGLSEALLAEGARSVRFVRLTGSRKAGLDDILGVRPEGRRAAYLARLIEQAKSKPADRRPRPAPTKKRQTSELTVDAERGVIVVNGDRYRVITDLTKALLDRHDGSRLFCYGGVVTQRKGTTLTPVNRDSFYGIVAETSVTVMASGSEGEERHVHAWPDGQTMGAILANAEQFSVLDKLAQMPFVRPDGSICQTPGYDEKTRTFVVLDPELETVIVPEDPCPEEVAAATKLLIEEWLGDFPFPSDADRANVLALVLTPFIRGLVPLAPLAVIDGKEAGSGKNLLADAISILISGRAAQPLPYTNDDTEQRKVITSAFRSGADLFVFDEAHLLDGASFARAITSVTYQDRVLGVSNLAEFPNRVTWISLGNKVQVFGDMGRRVYRISLAYEGESPENRPTSDFRHPDLRAWTTEQRATLLTACLTLVRAWFAAGQPTPRLPISMGSFEVWQKVIAGIVAGAGLDGFLANVREWRSESDFERQHWVAHLAWLYETFGDKEFTCAAVSDKLDRAGKAAEFPHKLEDPTVKGYARLLGQAYARHADRVLDGYRLSRSGRGHDNRLKWSINFTETAPETASNGGNGGDPLTYACKKTNYVIGDGDHVGAAEDSVAAAPQRRVLFPHGREGVSLSPVTPLPPTGGVVGVETADLRSPGNGVSPAGAVGAPVVGLLGMPHGDASPVTPIIPGVFYGLPDALPFRPAPHGQTSPIDVLLHAAPDQPAPPCRDCGGLRELVPPARFWFACPECHPATFHRD